MWNRSDAKYLSRMNDLATPRSNSTAREQYAQVRARISKADIANLKEYHKRWSRQNAAVAGARPCKRTGNSTTRSIKPPTRPSCSRRFGFATDLCSICCIRMRRRPIPDGISISACKTVTARNRRAVKQSIKADLMEGGARLPQLLQDIEAGATPSRRDAAMT